MVLLDPAGNTAGQCPRYDALTHRLSAAGGRLDTGAALDLLQTVSQTETLTQWSIVYDMSVGRVHVVMGRRFGRAHSFRLEQEPAASPTATRIH